MARRKSLMLRFALRRSVRMRQRADQKFGVHVHLASHTNIAFVKLFRIIDNYLLFIICEIFQRRRRHYLLLDEFADSVGLVENKSISCAS